MSIKCLNENAPHDVGVDYGYHDFLNNIISTQLQTLIQDFTFTRFVGVTFFFIMIGDQI